MQKTTIRFSVGFSDSIDTMPDEMVPAEVPGAVQLDWAAAHNYLPYYYGENWQQYLWMEDVYWHYRGKIETGISAPGAQIFLHGLGIDYHYRIRVNQTVVYEYEGMFRPFDVNITEYLTGDDELYIDLYPVPKKPGMPQDRSQVSNCCKAAVSYGWDWHPRLIPLGIWDDIWIASYPEGRIADSDFEYSLSDDLKKADFNFDFTVTEPDKSWRFTVCDGQQIIFQKQGEISGTHGNVKGTLEQVELWWPNEFGEQKLYSVKIELLKDGLPVEVKEKKIGFKTAELVMYQGGWDIPDRMPKSRSHPPITMKINGREIFCKGSNWVIPKIFYGKITADDYRELLQYAKDAHFNLLRIWGGGIVNKESFYELCDELGIMVWQEFPLACNNYENDAHYLEVLENESTAIIKKLRSHPCLSLWCGGNELFNAWSGMTEQSYALRLLDKNCYLYDPKTPYIMTSPLDGMAHGGYVFREPDGREVYQVFNSSHATAYTEFGCPSISDLEILRLIMPEKELFPPKADSAWTSHHGFDAFYSNCWAMTDLLEDYFGKANSIQDLITQSNILQSEGLKAIFEEARRQHPVCSMALNWNFCETWPTAAGNHIITWDKRPKPAYTAVKDSLRPILASARNQKFLWKEAETFAAELWMLNDSFNCIDSSTIIATLEADGHVIGKLKWESGDLDAQTNHIGPVFQVPLPKLRDGLITLRLVVMEHPEWSSEYRFMYRSLKESNQNRKTRLLNQ